MSSFSAIVLILSPAGGGDFILFYSVSLKRCWWHAQGLRRRKKRRNILILLPVSSPMAPATKSVSLNRNNGSSSAMVMMIIILGQLFSYNISLMKTVVCVVQLLYLCFMCTLFSFSCDQSVRHGLIIFNYYFHKHFALELSFN